MNKTILWCRADTQEELKSQENVLKTYKERQNLHVVQNILSIGKSDYLTWGILLQKAKYREYSILLIDALETMDLTIQELI